MNMPWYQRGTGEAAGEHQHLLGWSPGQGCPGSRETGIFGSQRAGVALTRTSGLASPHPHCAALAPTWTLRDFVTRMTLMCLCWCVIVPCPLKSKEKPSGMSCGQQIPHLQCARCPASPVPLFCVSPALVSTFPPSPCPRLQFFVVLTSQRELFPRLTADVRRFRKPPTLPPEPEAPGSSAASPGEASGLGLPSGPAPLFPPLAAEVGVARARLAQLVRLAGGHCRRDTLWKRLFLLEPPGPDRLRLGGRLALAELEELLEAVHAKSIGDIDPQLVSSCGF